MNHFSPNFYTDEPYNRDTIFLFAIKMIAKNPLIGMGATTFPIYYFMQNEIYIGHAHNLFLDFAFIREKSTPSLTCKTSIL